MLNDGLEWDEWVLSELIRQWFKFRHLFHAGRLPNRVALVTQDCAGGLSTRYPTADSVVNTDSTSASVEQVALTH